MVPLFGRHQLCQLNKLQCCTFVTDVLPSHDRLRPRPLLIQSPFFIKQLRLRLQNGSLPGAVGNHHISDIDQETRCHLVPVRKDLRPIRRHHRQLPRPLYLPSDCCRRLYRSPHQPRRLRPRNLLRQYLWLILPPPPTPAQPGPPDPRSRPSPPFCPEPSHRSAASPPLNPASPTSQTIAGKCSCLLSRF